ncbi:MAG TPA: pyridoxal-phosphate dependent enzyme [Candidatus Hydrogenedentes bacterium]|jgi:D-cysteine desulfhydrase|nr:pyridoxal-phosphate dependent enzyme [Candidatus Hydrogenedentota bacterium]HOR51998.1 pyridoxal-phosphate dependent enzyme [Candidatus Hydrogenedentota bacterium]HPK25833.1 pyridoxal-phosphate dependent enzyme [Candidatus Hydrogenedentota bacterium]
MSSSSLSSPALFRAFPALKTLPWLGLASLPTPLQDGSDALPGFNFGALHIKRDDRTHPQYGGNKVRKLSFLLARMQEQGLKHVITFGAAGSNHTLATALCANSLGMKSTVILGPQHNSAHVRENLLSYPSGATLLPADWQDFSGTAGRCFHRLWHGEGTPPCIIPAGGSSAPGTVGYVDAAFELKEQILEGLLPEPDFIYMPAGTLGSCVGLALGLLAAGLNSRVMAVSVTAPPFANMKRARALFQGCLQLLRNHDPSFPVFTSDEMPLTLREDYFGEDYALFTPEGMEAVHIARAALGLQLEGVYTGKTFAALLGDSSDGRLEGKNILFWNTHGINAQGTAAASKDTQDWSSLPIPLQKYFTEALQPLDKEG